MKHINSGQRSTPGRIQKLVADTEAKPAPGTALLAAIARTKNTNAAHQPKGKTA